jgi:hypothetical protein
MLKEHELQNQILKTQYSELNSKLTGLTRICEELDKKDKLYNNNKFHTGSFEKMFSTRAFKSKYGGLEGTFNERTNTTNTAKSFKK